MIEHRDIDDVLIWAEALKLLHTRIQTECTEEVSIGDALARLSGIMKSHIKTECWDDILMAAGYGKGFPSLGCGCEK